MTLIRMGVVTGGHSFDVIHFHHLLRDLEGVDSYVQHLEDFAAAPEADRDSYDVLLFYTMPRETPMGKPEVALSHLGSTTQGIVVMHHALLAHPGWPTWDEITGICGRDLERYSHDEQMPMVVADPQHPVTQGLSDWTMIDETYVMPDARAANGNHILLTTRHVDCMKTIAWTRHYRQSCVFCLQSGHDNQTWADVSFRQLLRQGILWSAGR